MTLLLLFLTLLLFLFAVEMQVTFSLNTDNEKISLDMSWLKPFFRLSYAFGSSPSSLSIFIFNIRVSTGKLTGNKVSGHTSYTDRMHIIQSLKLRETAVKTSYGFGDPSATGIACGILGALEQFIDIESLNQDPDFISDTDYINIYATSKLNIGLTLVNLIRTHTKGSTKKLAYQGR